MSRAVVVFLALGALFTIVPFGGMIWMAVASPPAYWGAAERILVVLLGTGGFVVFGLMVLSLIRTLALGLPRISVASDGLLVGRRRVDWRDVGPVGVAGGMGLWWLTLVLPTEATAPLPWYDRLAQRWTPPAADGRRPFWLAERQLGCRVAEALSRIPADHLNG